MATLQGHSILFDAPIGDHSIQLGENQLIENINVIYNPRTMRACLQLYMIVLIGQYILSFSSVPFDDVENRPPICIWTSIYSLLMVRKTSKFFLFFLLDNLDTNFPSFVLVRAYCRLPLLLSQLSHLTDTC